jgi:cellulose synthase/poly-beta-1,6-N-acetylglucosamine synthase-like glycosyltransferase
MPVAPSISFLVPTHKENRPLERCLNSIAPQLGPDDEVLVIGDTFDGPLPGVEALIRQNFDARFRYLPYDAGYHDYGHSQLNYGVHHARGQWIHANDDDDIWTPGAVQAMRAGIVAAGGQPLLYRFVSYVNRMVVWFERGRFERNYIGGHCLVYPNDPERLGSYGPAYNGDFDMLESTVGFYGGPDKAIWREEILCIARP